MLQLLLVYSKNAHGLHSQKHPRVYCPAVFWVAVARRLRSFDRDDRPPSRTPLVQCRWKAEARALFLVLMHLPALHSSVLDTAHFHFPSPFFLSSLFLAVLAFFLFPLFFQGKKREGERDTHHDSRRLSLPFHMFSLYRFVLAPSSSYAAEPARGCFACFAGS